VFSVDRLTGLDHGLALFPVLHIVADGRALVTTGLLAEPLTRAVLTSAGPSSSLARSYQLRTRHFISIPVKGNVV
jgi:hypothetical protein